MAALHDIIFFNDFIFLILYSSSLSVHFVISTNENDARPFVRVWLYSRIPPLTGSFPGLFAPLDLFANDLVMSK